MNAAIHQFALPKTQPSGRVLDVGCADGAALMHPFYRKATERHGIDIDAEAIGHGRWRYPSLNLIVGDAGKPLPYPDAHFEMVISKVSLPYVDLRMAIPECARVLASCGQLFLTLHDFRYFVRQFTNALKARAPRRVIDHAYILGASLAYIATGYVPARPWDGSRETFQTKSAIRRDLGRVGFGAVEFERTARDWIITARKA